MFEFELIESFVISYPIVGCANDIFRIFYHENLVSKDTSKPV